MNGFHTVCEVYNAFKLILCELKTFWRKTHTNMHQQLFAYIHANACIHTTQDAHTNILQSIGPPPTFIVTAKLQLVLSDIQESLHDLQLQQF